MRSRCREFEPLCETSEKGENLIPIEEMLPVTLEIGHRVLEVFGNQQISNIVFRLKSNSREINSVINGQALPTAELLLGIQKITGVSIDWLLTGNGSKYLPLNPIQNRTSETIATELWFVNEVWERPIPIQ